jgi:uncharacterized protein YukE
VPFLPAAFPLAILFWSLVADPETMSRTAAEWRDGSPTEAQAQVLQKPEEWHPPMADDITLLREGLRSLVELAESKKDWQGTSFEAFKALAAEFDKGLETLGELRKDVSGSLASATTAFSVLALFLLAVSAYVFAVAVYAKGAGITPATFAAAQIAGTQAVSSTYSMVSRTVWMMSKLTMKITGILGVVGYSAATLTAQFPGMQAMKGETPNFTKATALWDQEGLTIKESPVADAPKMPDGGVFGKLFGMN